MKLGKLGWREEKVCRSWGEGEENVMAGQPGSRDHQCFSPATGRFGFSAMSTLYFGA